MDKWGSVFRVFMICFITHLIFITSYVGYDESNFLSIGWFMVNKDYRLYSHSNDNKLPFAYIPIHIIGILFSGVEMIIYSRLYAVLLYSLIAALVCFIVIDLFKDEMGGFLAGVVFSLFSASEFSFTYTYITFMIILQTLLFYFLSKNKWFLSGLCFGGMFFTIQTSLFSLPLILYRLLWVGGKIKSIMKLMLGFIFCAILVFTYMLFNTNLNGVWFNVVEYNMLPAFFPNSSLSTKSFLLEDWFYSNISLFLVCLSSIGFIIHDRGRKDWISRGLVVWLLSVIFMIFSLAHVWGQYLMYFYVPVAVLFGWFVSVRKDCRESVILFGMIMLVLTHNFLIQTNHLKDGETLFMDVERSQSFIGCGSLYLIGNEDDYVITGIAPPQHYVTSKADLFFDSWSLWSRNKELLLDYVVVDSLLSEVDCVGIVPPASNDGSITTNNNLLFLLERNNFTSSSLPYGGVLWKKF